MIVPCMAPTVSEAQSHTSGTVTIVAEVQVYAKLAFPEDADFLITVTDPTSPDGATIQPVRIGFTVTGNAHASVSVAPDAFVLIASGPALGEALGPDGGTRSLGYDIVVQFPVPAPDHAGLPGRGGFGNWPQRDNLASLPGHVGEGTPALSADVAARDGVAYGTIHIVAEHDWTPSGGNATPGEYAGSVEVTLVADSE